MSPRSMIINMKKLTVGVKHVGVALNFPFSFNDVKHKDTGKQDDA